MRFVLNRLNKEQIKFLFCEQLGESPDFLMVPSSGFHYSYDEVEWHLLRLPMNYYLSGIVQVHEIKGDRLRVNWAYGGRFKNDLWVRREEFEQRCTSAYLFLLLTVGVFLAITNTLRGIKP